MSGLTPVQVGTDVYRINHVRVAQTGTGLTAAGNITIASGGVTYGYIAAGFTRQRLMVYTVPLGKALYINNISFSTGQQKATSYARFTTKANYDNVNAIILQRGLFMAYHEMLICDNTLNKELYPPTKFPATVDLKVSVVSSVGADTVDCSCALRGWLETV